MPYIIPFLMKVGDGCYIESQPIQMRTVTQVSGCTRLARTPLFQSSVDSFPVGRNRK